MTLERRDYDGWGCVSNLSDDQAPPTVAAQRYVQCGSGFKSLLDVSVGCHAGSWRL